MLHSYNIKVAKLVGLEKAVLLYNISYWIAYNRANKINFIDGYTWTYNSAKAYLELFQELASNDENAPERKIKKLLYELETKDGILVSANYNKNSFNKTKWYRINEKFYWMLEDHMSSENLQSFLNEKTINQKRSIDSPKTDYQNVQKETIDSPKTDYHYSKNNTDANINYTNINKNNYLFGASAQKNTKNEKSMTLNFKTSVEKLDNEYLETLKLKIENYQKEHIGAMSFETFLNQCRIHDYKYKNFWLAYLNWAQKDGNKNLNDDELYKKYSQFGAKKPTENKTYKPEFKELL